MAEIQQIDLNRRRVVADSAHADPLIGKVSWYPLTKSWKSQRQLRLVVEPDKACITNTRGAVSSAAGPAFVGVVLVGTGGFLGWEMRSWGWGIAAVVGAGMIKIAVESLRTKDLMVFDRRRGLYFTGGRRNKRRAAKGRLSDIHALQVLRELEDSGNASAPLASYELNVVLDSGERLSVIEKWTEEEIMDVADTLAGVLGVPIWNGVAQQPGARQSASGGPMRPVAGASGKREVGLTLHDTDDPVANLVSWAPLIGRVRTGSAYRLRMDHQIACVANGRWRSKPLWFDKTRGVYYRGKQYDPNTPWGENHGPLGEIHALQMLQKRQHIERTHHSTELNVVFRDGRRIPLAEDARPARIARMASELGNFLGVPVWEGVFG